MDLNSAPAERWAVISSFTTDIDLTTHAKGNGQPARAIQVLSAGSGRLYVIKPGLTGANAREDLTGLTAGFMLLGAVKIIKKSTYTTVSSIIVYW